MPKVDIFMHSLNKHTNRSSVCLISDFLLFQYSYEDKYFNKNSVDTVILNEEYDCFIIQANKLLENSNCIRLIYYIYC